MYKTSVKGTVRPDQIGVRVKPLQKNVLAIGQQPLYVIAFLILTEFLNRVISSKPLYTKKPLILGGRLVCARAVPFLDKAVPKKMCESYTRVRRAVWLLTKGLASTPFWRNFHQIKVCQPIGRKCTIQIVLPRTRGQDKILY